MKRIIRWIQGRPPPHRNNGNPLATDRIYAPSAGNIDGVKTELPSHRRQQLLPSGDDTYYVKQRFGYFAIIFSIIQTLVLILMMMNGGVAPFQQNPMIGPYPDTFTDWGAKDVDKIVGEGEWFRLLTPVFLHAGIIHLLCNVAVQLETGAFFEKEWGSLIWVVIYLLSAVGASTLSCIFLPEAVSVGSSGACMGLFGGKLGEVVCRRSEPNRTEQDRIGHEVRREQMGAVLCSVAMVLAFSFIPFVDWAAHLGGLMAGLLIGTTIFSRRIRSKGWRNFWFFTSLVTTVISFVMALQYMYANG